MDDKNPGEIPDVLLPTYMAKSLRAMKVPRSFKRITFNNSEASPGETLHVSVPKMNKNEVLVPSLLALRFDIELDGGHANNFLVQNLTCALVDQQVIKFAGETLEETVGYNIYKTFEDLFLPVKKHDNIVQEGIQSKDLCKVHSNAGDKKTLGVEAEKKLNKIFGSKYYIRLDHQILTDHGISFPRGLNNDLTFKVTLTSASQVVRGSDPSKLKYKLTSI